MENKGVEAKKTTDTADDFVRRPCPLVRMKLVDVERVVELAAAGPASCAGLEHHAQRPVLLPPHILKGQGALREDVLDPLVRVKVSDVDHAPIHYESAAAGGEGIHGG